MAMFTLKVVAIPNTKSALALLLAAVVFLCVAAMQLEVAEANQVLIPGYYLPPGTQLVEGPYSFIMQTDCNLVLYRSGVGAIWASNTQNKGTNCYFIMQSDGNAVVYTGSNVAVFATNTCCRNDGAHYIIVQSDGNVVMYTGVGNPIWATSTNGRQLDLTTSEPPAKGPLSNTLFQEQTVQL